MAQLLRSLIRIGYRNWGYNQLYRSPVQPLTSTRTWIQKRLASQKLSYVHGLGTKPLLGVTLPHMVDRALDLFGDREAIVVRHQNIRKNFQQYHEDIEKLATGFLALNLKKGDRIGIMLPNRYEWPLVQFAAAKTGLILATLNPAYQVAELEYCIRKLDMKAIVMQEAFKTQDYYKMVTSLLPEMTETKPGTKVKSKKYPYLDTIIFLSDRDLPGTFKFKDVFEAGGSTEKRALEDVQSKIDFCDPVIIQFTSGTTGQPKAPILSHHSIVNGGFTVGERLGFDAKHIHYLAPVPMFHAFGCLGILFFNVINGNCSVLPSEGYNTNDTIQAIEEFRCEAMAGTPTMLIDILRNPTFDKTDVSSLKKLFLGGAPCSPFLLKTLTEKLGTTDICNGYGATEISGGCFIHHRDDLVEDKLQTVGRVYDHLEAKLIDENGKVVPVGTPGEICVRGFKLMLGYWGDPEKTKEVLTTDGWYKSGDVGILDDRGYLRITDRIKHMVIRGGENIFPTEIENCLMTHPKISEVQVIGVPDDRMGEELSAFVILKANQTMTETEVRDFCKGKIAHFKIPRYIQFVDSLPKTQSGKVQKFLLREKMQQILSMKPV